MYFQQQDAKVKETVRNSLMRQKREKERLMDISGERMVDVGGPCCVADLLEKSDVTKTMGVNSISDGGLAQPTKRSVSENLGINSLSDGGLAHPTKPSVSEYSRSFPEYIPKKSARNYACISKSLQDT